MSAEQRSGDGGEPAGPVSGREPAADGGPGAASGESGESGAFGGSGGSGGSGAAEAPGAPEASGVDLARVALRAAREQARARGAAAQQRKQVRRGGGLRSGARADGRDPLPLGAAVSRLIAERGWETPAAVGGVMGRWPQLVGREVAQHCAPERFDEREQVLVVRCDSTAWATQLRLLAPQLVARLNEDLGHGTVKLIKVVGPGGGGRSFGSLRVPGSGG